MFVSHVAQKIGTYRIQILTLWFHWLFTEAYAYIRDNLGLNNSQVGVCQPNPPGPTCHPRPPPTNNAADEVYLGAKSEITRREHEDCGQQPLDY